MRYLVLSWAAAACLLVLTCHETVMAQTCVSSQTTLCLGNNRFSVQANWQDFQGNFGQGKVVPNAGADSGLFWFFGPGNWELLVKVLNGCGTNGRFWVLGSAGTNVGYTVIVTDTMSGEVKQYANPLGTTSPAIIDINAFTRCDLQVTPPPPAAGINLEVQESSVLLERSAGLNWYSVRGKVINHDVRDATFVRVGVAAYDAQGKLLGGDFTFAAGTNRNLGYTFYNNACLLAGETGYFEATLGSLPGTPASLEFFPIADVDSTLPPTGGVSANLATSQNAFGETVVSGTLSNPTATCVGWIDVDIVLLDNLGRVLDIAYYLAPSSLTLCAGGTASFSASSTAQYSQVASVLVRPQWDDVITSPSLPQSEAQSASESRNERTLRLQSRVRKAGLSAETVPGKTTRVTNPK